MDPRGALLGAAAVLLLIPATLGAQEQSFHAGVRFLSVRPHDSSGTIATTGTRLGVDPTRTGELDLTYMITWAWGVELGLSRTRPALTSTGGSFGGLKAGTIGMSFASATVQYHFETLGRLRPYLGVGASLASFSGYHPSHDLGSTGVSAISFTDSLGVASQAGLDVAVTDRVSVNLDVRYLTIGSDAKISHVTSGTLDTIRLDFNPWLIGIGVGYRF